MPFPRLFDRQEMEALHRAGWTVYEMAERFRVSSEAIRHALADQGIEAPNRPDTKVGRKKGSGRSPLERMLARIDTTAEHWVWPGQLKAGVPICGVTEPRPTSVAVPRVLWEHFVGELGTRKLQRACDVDRCVRPAHHLPGPGTSVGLSARREARTTPST
jgi:hypothetical protein